MTKLLVTALLGEMIFRPVRWPSSCEPVTVREAGTSFFSVL